MRTNPVSAASSAPSFAAMIERINSVKAGDVAKLSEPRSVSPAMRLSLATFLEEWTESDVGHEKYLDNLLSGFEDVEALKMGDLLEWMAIGTDNQFENEVSLPKGVDHKELVGLHAELLDFLPLKSYNTFTMISLLEDDPELVEEVFNNYIELTATEHDALQALTTIVKRGSIESIRLLLEASPKYEDEGYGFTQTKNYGTLLVDTFELCRRAAAAYKDGNYIGSKALLDQLYDEKGINPQLIRMDLSKMAPMTLRIKVGDKLIGPGDLVLASPMYSSFDKKQLVDAATSKEAGKAEQSKKIVQFDQWRGDWKALIFTLKSNEKNSVRILAKNESDAKMKLNKLLGNAKTSKTADDIMNSDVTYDLEITTEKTKSEGRNLTVIKKINAVSSDEEEDTEEDMLPTGDESAEKPAITKYDKVLTEADILELLHQHGSTELRGGGGGGGNNKEKAKPIGCNVSTLMTQIYGNNIRQDSSATFTIHAILKTGGKKDERKMSGDLIPKGTVTFSANREGKTSTQFKASFAMVIEMLPSHEVERKEVLRTTVDPLDEAISGTKPETRRNPITAPIKRDKPRFTHRYYPATMKKYRKDAPWVFPGQTMSGHGVEMFREATQGTPGQNIQDTELYFDMQMDGRPLETDVYVEDGSRFRYIGTIKSVPHRGKLGKSPKDNPVRDYEGILHHGDGPHKTQTQAREIAKIMAERGEDMYLWQVHLPKDSTYGFGDGWMISQDHPTNVPANQVRRFPASSKPKNNPDHEIGPIANLPLARSVGKVMAERGRRVYLWYCDQSGGWMVSHDYPGSPSGFTDKNVLTIPASSKPKKNPVDAYETGDRRGSRHLYGDYATADGTWVPNELRERTAHLTEPPFKTLDEITRAIDELMFFHSGRKININGLWLGTKKDKWGRSPDWIFEPHEARIKLRDILLYDIVGNLDDDAPEYIKDLALNVELSLGLLNQDDVSAWGRPANPSPKNNPEWVPYKLKDISVSQNRKKYPKSKIPKLVMYDYPHYEIVEGPYKGTVLWRVSAGYVNDQGQHLAGFATGGTYVGGGKAWQVDEYEEPSVARLHGKAIVGKNNPEKPKDDEVWDISVGGMVKKPKPKKSTKKSQDKTRIPNVELGYDDREEQTRQILGKRKMDAKDWKESLERQGYGTNPKGPGKKRTSAVGNTYAIDLIPRSSVSLTAKSVKFSNKLLHKWRDSSAEMKAFWKKYTATGTGGGNTVYVADETFKTKYFRMKKGQKWNPNSPPLVPEAKDELKEMLEKRNTDRKKWIRREMSKFVKKGKLIPQPGSQQTKQTGDSYVTYKGGKVSMRMILAKHKKSGSFVPYRLLVPAAALRMEGNTLVPRSGSADAKGAKQLLSLIEDTFGKITFHKNMGKGGLKVGRINVDEGVAKVFKTGGLKTEGGAVARPYLYDDKRLTYIAKGRQYTMELA